MKKIILLIVLSPSIVFGSWNEEKTARELCFLYTLAIDREQTLDIIKSESLYERNHLHGKHPSQSAINLYTIGCAVGHALVSYLITDENIARWWQQGWIICQSSVVRKNNNNGLNQNMGLSWKMKYVINW